MNPSLKCLAALVLSALALSACGADSHLKIKLSSNQFYPNIPELRITAEQDVTIRGIEVNDGDCGLNMLVRFPIVLAKGESDHVDIRSDCDQVSKVKIRTTDGEFKYTF
ncbi:hypothetical protein [Paraburkholderia caribensis]|uniref:hypothetical protein n=1 Tax=Paraburkholderia caribensis TaxID=75105 RepID=UPI0007207DCD|nr:hypothetical protein [Paraburkholderia caribensis]ALP63992.1 hypothetical protein AN416_01305 [Paraburkholderia caribensis]AUT53302.1 hypothetical protein C2L66_00720 [Paraburkholderia caribensis]